MSSPNSWKRVAAGLLAAVLILVAAYELVDAIETGTVDPADRPPSSRAGGSPPPPGSGWIARYGGDGGEEVEGVSAVSDGGFMVAGATSSYGDEAGDAWVVKLDSGGSIEWQKTYGGEGTEQAWSIEPMRDGGFTVAGGTTSFGAGGADLWVLRLDADGGILWQETIGGPSDDGGGGEYDEYVVRALKDEDGDIVVASNTQSFGSGGTDIWVVKLDPAGEVLWQKAYGGRYGEGLWSFAAVSRTGAGAEYVVPGVTETFSPDESGDTWVLRLDEDGGIVWQKVYAVGGYWDEALAVSPAPDGGALVGGYVEEEDDWDLTLLRVDRGGEALWQAAYEHTWDWPNAVDVLEDGSFVVAGVAWPHDADRPEDLLAMRFGEGGPDGDECGLVRDLSLDQLDTHARPVDTEAAVRDTQVVPRTSSAEVRDSAASPAYLCPDDGGGPPG